MSYGYFGYFDRYGRFCSINKVSFTKQDIANDNEEYVEGKIYWVGEYYETFEDFWQEYLKNPMKPRIDIITPDMVGGLDYNDFKLPLEEEYIKRLNDF
jgi:hypothetical protein